MDDKIVDYLIDAIELVELSGEEKSLENITKAAFYLKRLYELNLQTNIEN